MSANGYTANVAYGFRIAGLAQTDALEMIGPPPAEVLQVTQSSARYSGDASGVFADTAVLRHASGASLIERIPRRMTIHSPTPLRESELVHPLLWPAAAICAAWMGRETLHAGAFLDDDGAAWLILGDSGAGKSSLLAALALAGREILADDLIVLDNDQCFAGPRCIDLSPESVRGLGIEARTHTVRWSRRERLRLPPIAGHLPLGGFICLTWSRSLAVDLMPPRERISNLAGNRRVPDLGVQPLDLLKLSTFPALLLQRPRDWRQIDATSALLLEATRSHSRKTAGRGLA